LDFADAKYFVYSIALAPISFQKIHILRQILLSCSCNYKECSMAQSTSLAFVWRACANGSYRFIKITYQQNTYFIWRNLSRLTGGIAKALSYATKPASALLLISSIREVVLARISRPALLIYSSVKKPPACTRTGANVDDDPKDIGFGFPAHYCCVQY